MIKNSLQRQRKTKTQISTVPQVNSPKQGQLSAVFLNVYRNTALQRHRAEWAIHTGNHKTGKIANGSKNIERGIDVFFCCFSFSLRIVSLRKQDNALQDNGMLVSFLPVPLVCSGQLISSGIVSIQCFLVS